ncbi:SRPBCC family protein [Pengzhenrongella frigida]|uniref:SRPBCC domain-containing protein n=1 Tax=Pengzhenrongella frigida TaxID=1259133 RepID=A0A4Q5N440_9MICO|nr:SRPBCC domain-containing protein [Cellulomonas sp. HLT2-17]RYV53022.1 SRPBCC domain-containing protein [Cellulomonas sp. HLT2-17]
MPDDQRSIVLEVEVAGTPEEVWQAIATGPGISSWYVPHTVEERAGGAMTLSFGDGPDMQVAGRVVAWDPPRRVLFDGGDGGLAFEWLVEARDGGRCLVRLVNAVFGTGPEWDAQYDGMAQGWKMFLLNLQLHLEHFRGQVATAMLPTAMWEVPAHAAWAALTEALHLPASPAIGERVVVRATDTPTLSGTVVDAAGWRLALLLDGPCPGTAFLAVEGTGEQVSVSIWSYLYGPDRAVVAAREAPHWQRWLTEHAPS